MIYPVLSASEWLFQLSTSWALFSLIWIIQLVHYPTYRYIDLKQFYAFQKHHTFSITWIVMPLMLIELSIMLWQCWQSSFHWMWLVPMLFVLAIWISTFFIQIPLHTQLTMQYDPKAIEKLIRSNWWRTIFWTLKTLWISGLFYGSISGLM